MTDDTIYPTHTCFDDSLDLFNDLVHGNPFRAATLRLVHGIVMGGSAHAWVEDIEQKIAIFVGIQHGQRETFCAPIEEYDKSFGVTERIQYTYDEAVRLNRESGDYGPWIERYRQLCGRVQT